MRPLLRRRGWGGEGGGGGRKARRAPYYLPTHTHTHNQHKPFFLFVLVSEEEKKRQIDRETIFEKEARTRQIDYKNVCVCLCEYMRISVYQKKN
jgi:hypothetical protein